MRSSRHSREAWRVRGPALGPAQRKVKQQAHCPCDHQSRLPSPGLQRNSVPLRDCGPLATALKKGRELVRVHIAASLLRLPDARRNSALPESVSSLRRTVAGGTVAADALGVVNSNRGAAGCPAAFLGSFGILQPRFPTEDPRRCSHADAPVALNRVQYPGRSRYSPPRFQ